MTALDVHASYSILFKKVVPGRKVAPNLYSELIRNTMLFYQLKFLSQIE